MLAVRITNMNKWFRNNFDRGIDPYSKLHTPRSRVLPEKLTCRQLVKKIPAFYGTRRLTTSFTSAHHLFLSLVSSIQSVPPHLNIIVPSTPGSSKWFLSAENVSYKKKSDHVKVTGTRGKEEKKNKKNKKKKKKAIVAKHCVKKYFTIFVAGLSNQWATHSHRGRKGYSNIYIYTIL